MNKIKITNHQLFSLTFHAAIGGSLFVISAAITRIAKQDVWITPLVTAIFGMPIIWIYWFLGSQHPNMTFVGMIRRIFGKWIGLIFAAGYVFLCLTISCHLPWFIGNFMTLQAMPETPVYVINSLFVAAMLIAVLYGIETIARASELFMYLVSILLIFVIVLVSPNARIENLQPILEKGIIPILKSSIFLSALITFPCIILMMIFPININNIPKAKKSLLKGYIWNIFLVFITILMTILVLGSAVTANLEYPTYILVKEINIGLIFTRLEFILEVSWLITQFIVGLLYFYAGITGLSELLGLKDHKKIVIPFGLIICVTSGVVYPDAIYQANWAVVAWTPWIITYGLILPVLLLFVFLTKKWIFKRR